MTVDKYVAILDGDDNLDRGSRAAILEGLIARGEAAPPGVAGLTVGAVTEPLTGPAGTVAVLDVWIDSGADARDVLARLVDPSGMHLSAWRVEEIVFTSPRDWRTSGGEHERVKLFGTAARREDFTVLEFFAYWVNTHAPISAAVPGSTGYVVSRVSETLKAPVARTIDAFVELWWPSRESFDAAGESDAQAAAWEDVANYARTDGQFWLIHETVVRSPPESAPGLLDEGV